MKTPYLTPEMKHQTLSSLQEFRDADDVDEVMNPYIDRINALEYAVTEESCQGHEEHDGLIVFRLTKEKCEQFETELCNGGHERLTEAGFWTMDQKFRRGAADYVFWFYSKKREVAMKTLCFTLEGLANG